MKNKITYPWTGFGKFNSYKYEVEAFSKWLESELGEFNFTNQEFDEHDLMLVFKSFAEYVTTVKKSCQENNKV